MKIDKSKLPNYIKIGHTAMKLSDSNVHYWRDAGAWGVTVNKNTNGQLVVNKIYDNYTEISLTHLKGVPVLECTKQEWEEDNKGYL